MTLKQQIEKSIHKSLSGDAQKNALDFAGYLRENEMLFENGKGYWRDKLYWTVRYKGECVCFILINVSDDSEDMTEPTGWIVWSDDSGSNCFSDYQLDERMRDIAWRSVDFCVNCGGGCGPGTQKRIFGKDFNNVCRVSMKFVNPDSSAVEFMKEMVLIRKNDILQSAAFSNKT